MKKVGKYLLVVAFCFLAVGCDTKEKENKPVADTNIEEETEKNKKNNRKYMIDVNYDEMIKTMESKGFAITVEEVGSNPDINQYSVQIIRSFIPGAGDKQPDDFVRFTVGFLDDEMYGCTISSGDYYGGDYYGMYEAFNYKMTEVKASNEEARARYQTKWDVTLEELGGYSDAQILSFAQLFYDKNK